MFNSFQVNQLLNEGKFREAESLVESWLKKNKPSNEVLHLLAVTKLNQGKQVEAENILSDIINSKSPFLPSIKFLAKLLFKTNKLNKLITTLEKFINSKSLDEECLFYLVSAYFKLSNYTQAKNVIANLVPKNTKHSAFFSYLALIYKEEGDFNSALYAIEKALQLNPNAIDVIQNKATILSQLQRYNEAISLLSKVDKRIPKNATVYHNFASAYNGLGETETALTYFQKAIEVEPYNPLHHKWYSQLRWRIGDSNFLQSYKDVLSKQPNCHALRRELIIKFIQAEYYDEVEEHLNYLLENEPRFPGNLKLAGEFYRKVRRFDKALYLHQQAKNLLPNDPYIQEALATSLLSVGKANDALVIINNLINVNKENQGYWSLKGIALRMLSSEEYHRLFDYSKLVLKSKIKAPKGFVSLDDFNSALMKELLPMHNTTSHPLDQSLKNGSQTNGNLFFEHNELVQLLKTEMDNTFNEFLSSLPKDEQHPALSQNTGKFKYTGAWSVLLKTSGFHVSHYHSHGWFSGPYYVHIPKNMSGETGYEGCLKLGEPGFEMAEPLEPDFIIKPEPGMLVRFPSYMWHGTYPFESDEPRIIVASDLVSA